MLLLYSIYSMTPKKQPKHKPTKMRRVYKPAEKLGLAMLGRDDFFPGKV